jgi:2-methylcitrate dehydratase PrpD
MELKPSPMPIVSEYIANALSQPLPDHVLEKTKFHFLDTIASMISGSTMLAGEKAIQFIQAQGVSAPQASLLGTRIKTTAINAALANGMFGHADETDDSHAESLTHPGCGIVAAVLAAGELQNRSGLELLKAMTLGYDICCRLTKSLHPYQFRANGHSSHTFGPNFGAAAAAGALLDVNAAQARYLLSYAAQQASGVSCWMRDKDHIEKAFDFGGMAARNGMTSALMVANGFTGVEDVFSGERNFYDAYGIDPLRQELGVDLGKRYEILQTSIKRWTVGSPIQAPLDCVDEILHTKDKSLDPSNITSIHVQIPHESLTIVNNREMPEICLQHLVALMIVEGKMDFHLAHDRSRMSDPKVIELRKLIHLEGSDALSKNMPTRQGIVRITLNSGEDIEVYTRDVKGTPNNPMNRSELDRKCTDLMSPILGLAQSQSLCKAVWQLEHEPSARDFASLLAPAS